MTKKQFDKKVDVGIRCISRELKKEAYRLLFHVNKADYPDDFRLPRIILTRALLNYAGVYKPISITSKAEVARLEGV
jgi:hypothetical protein